MAIVIAMLARGRPLAIVAFSLMFGVALSLSTLLQIAGINLAPEVVNIIPFAAIILALVLFALFFVLPALYVVIRVLWTRDRRAILNLALALVVLILVAAIWYWPHFHDVIANGVYIYRVPIWG